MASFTSRTITALLRAENHYVDSESHIGFHARPGSAEPFKRLSLSNRLGPHSVCVKHNSCRHCDQVLLQGMTEKYLSCRSASTNTYSMSQKTQANIRNRQLIQHNVFMHRFFFFPEQTHILTGITILNWQRKTAHVLLMRWLTVLHSFSPDNVL